MVFNCIILVETLFWINFVEIDPQHFREWLNSRLINWYFLDLRTFFPKSPSTTSCCSPSLISIQGLLEKHFEIALWVRPDWMILNDQSIDRLSHHSFKVLKIRLNYDCLYWLFSQISLLMIVAQGTATKPVSPHRSY